MEFGTQNDPSPKHFKRKHSKRFTAQRDLAHALNGIRSKTESRWIGICSVFKYFVVISVLISYLLPTYLAIFDIRYFDLKSGTGMILHSADFVYLVDVLYRIIFEDLHLFRYTYEPTGGSCYQVSMALDRWWHISTSIIFLAQLFPLEYFALFWKNTDSIIWLRIFACLRLYRVFRIGYIYQWFSKLNNS